MKQKYRLYLFKLLVCFYFEFVFIQIVQILSFKCIWKLDVPIY